MSVTLYRDKVPFFTRGPERHWWLTGFHWGTFSQPSQLRMEAVINFDTQGMCDQFKGALAATGYSCCPSGRSVAFAFDKPMTQQPHSRALGGDGAQSANGNLVAAFKLLKIAVGAKSNDPNEFVLPPEWTNPVRDAAERVAHEAAATAATLHEGGAAAAARLRANATAVAATFKQVAAAGAKDIGHRIEAAQSAYRDVLGFLQRPRWR